jgi:hypothetical protein
VVEARVSAARGSSLARGYATYGCLVALATCATNDIEFHSLKLTQHLCNVTCRPLTLWPSAPAGHGGRGGRFG